MGGLVSGVLGAQVGDVAGFDQRAEAVGAVLAPDYGNVSQRYVLSVSEEDTGGMVFVDALVDAEQPVVEAVPRFRPSVDPDADAVERRVLNGAIRAVEVDDQWGVAVQDGAGEIVVGWIIPAATARAASPSAL